MSDKETLGEGNWLRLVRKGRWEWIQRTNVSGVVGIYAFTDNDEVVLVEQPRAPHDHRKVIEIPAGLSGDIVGEEDEAFETAAHRELEEETGFRAKRLKYILEQPTCAGMSDETIHLYVADGLTRVGEGGGDDTEEIEVHVVPMSELDAFFGARIAQGQLIDAKALAVQYFASLR